MKITMMFIEAVRHFLALPLRSFLSLIAIVLGIAAMIAMLLGEKIAENEAEKPFAKMGINFLHVAIHDDEEQKNKLSWQDIRRVFNNKKIISIAPYISFFKSMQFIHVTIPVEIVGVTDDFSGMLKLSTDRGRFISKLDRAQTFCVLSDGVYQKIKKETLADPFNQPIKIGNSFYRVIGILRQANNNPLIYANLNESIYIPIENALILQKTKIPSTLLLKVSNTKAVEKMAFTFPVTLTSAENAIAALAAEKETLNVFLGFFSGLSLLVGGLGMMNVLLLSVLERKKEIGLRRAVGAAKKDILLLFLMEALLLAIFGGCLGVVMGLVLTECMAIYWHYEFLFYLQPIIESFVITLLLGVLSGSYPAYVATKLSPLEAMRG